MRVSKENINDTLPRDDVSPRGYVGSQQNKVATVSTSV